MNSVSRSGVAVGTNLLANAICQRDNERKTSNSRPLLALLRAEGVVEAGMGTYKTSLQ